MNGLKYQKKRAAKAKRRQKIKDFYATGGVSLADAADKFGISRARVWQIVRDYSK